MAQGSTSLVLMEISPHLFFSWKFHASAPLIVELSLDALPDFVESCPNIRVKRLVGAAPPRQCKTWQTADTSLPLLVVVSSYFHHRRRRSADHSPPSSVPVLRY